LKYFKAVDNGKKVDVLIESVKWFGQDVIATEDSNGDFKTFEKKIWIHTDKKRFVEDKYILQDIRKHFSNYSVVVTEHRKMKKNKLRKAHSRLYEVLVEGAIKVDKATHEIIIEAIKRKTLFPYKGGTYFYIYETFFRETNQNEYVHYDVEKHYLYNTQVNIEDHPIKQKLSKFLDSIRGERK